MARTIAQAPGQPEAGDALIAEFETEFAAIRDANPAFSDLTVLYVEPGDGTFTIRG